MKTHCTAHLSFPRPNVHAAIAAALVAVATSQSANASLLAQYSFDSLGAHIPDLSSIPDLSGNGNNAIVHGALTSTTGVAGNGVWFGGNGFLEVPAAAGINLGSGSKMTWILSLKRDNCIAPPYQRGVPELNILSKFDNRPAAGSDGGFVFGIANNSPSFEFASAGPNQRHIEPIAPVSEWSQLVLIKDDANWSLYQNGQPLPGFDAHFGQPGIWGVGNPFASSDFEPANNAPLFIGGRANYMQPDPILAAGSKFMGAMDEISIYDEALSQSQLAALGISITPGPTLNSFSSLRGEAPDNLPSWPWEANAAGCPDSLPAWSALSALFLPLVFRRRSQNSQAAR